jgi:DNA-nicking Smr family endonuclease
MARKRSLRPEEKAIWRKVAGSVKPLSEAMTRSLEDPQAIEPESEKPAPDKKLALRHGHFPHPHSVPKHPALPVDRGGEKRVRKGRLEIDGRIDLHGLTQDMALRTLRNFLAMAYRDGYKTVLVITGKGLKARERESEPWENHDEPGVLKRKLPEWLGNPEFRQWVSGYAIAHLRHGGGGAFYVTMRRVKPVK